MARRSPRRLNRDAHKKAQGGQQAEPTTAPEPEPEKEKAPAKKAAKKS